MASSTYERPEWIKPDDPLFAMLSYKCINTMIWLIRNLPRRTPRNSAGNVISLLEYFLSMDETNFWMVMDRCPECTSNLLINARDRHLQRKANRLANMIAQEDVLEIGMLTKIVQKIGQDALLTENFH
ncbi:hypothetical protein evm_008621 [Chilo suppressalis]|nr:hypothetical protein evm_014263 [Chilo suppressalis]RVE46758.1 hypothetical protein evm_008621 [Chilo suppressalis]